MKRRFALVTLCLGMALPGWCAGLIIIHDGNFWEPHPILPHPPRPRPIPPPFRPAPQPAWAPLEVSFTKVDVKIKDQIAVTSVDQEFYNPNPRQLEGTFLFPVPKGAQINKFTMEINGKPVEAELLAADKARGIYEDIVRKLKDPALLEYSGRDLFKVRIFPIEANGRKRVHLSYSQVLKTDNGLLNFLFPLNTEKFSAKPLKNLSVKVELESKRALKSIYSPSHKVEIKRDGPKRAVIGFEANDVKPDSDFQLFYTQEESDLGVSLMTFKTAHDDGYFLLLASPGAEVKNTKVIPKDVTFVLDTSGSMAGAKLEQAKKALLFCVENLNDVDRFEIMRFSTEVEPLFSKLVEADAKNRARARDFIKDLKPIGGTAIDDALKKALSSRPEAGERPYVVTFLTDGRPTVGTTDEDLIVRSVKEGNKSNTRVFCFGIGTDVNTHLLDKITEETKAFSQYVLPEEDLEVKVSAFFTKIKEPALANPKITFPGEARVTKLYPSPVPDLFKGEQLLLAGRYSGQGNGAVQIEGTVNGETKKFAYDVKFPGAANDHEFIPRLWATRRVGYLLDEIRLRGESKELKDEITELARQYGIVTPYTAYLIVEDERQRGIAHNVQSLPMLQNNVQLRRESAQVYFDFAKAKDGDKALGGARSFQQLKLAESSVNAISSGNAETFRAAPLAATPPPAGFTYSVDSFSSVTNATTLSAARQYGQQSRFVQNRAFYQNGNQWIDFEVQKLSNARRVRVPFDSPEYFDLVKKNSKVLAWLALGRNVQLVLDGIVYEIYE